MIRQKPVEQNHIDRFVSQRLARRREARHTRERQRTTHRRAQQVDNPPSFNRIIFDKQNRKFGTRHDHKPLRR
jgi:FixJ family two-component response regulator